MTKDAVLGTSPLGSPWEGADPFLFCIYHNDAYPSGNERLGPAASLAGRNIGHDFDGKDGWRMYHGQVVPGFPRHPHRGFETVTVMRRGYIDHSDSVGATARLGPGDVQWITTGAGVVHSEMFPLLERDKPNPLELFQIWLNLPSKHKMADPYFTLFWSEDIRRHTTSDEQGRKTVVTVVAGPIGGSTAPPPPPHSWAADPRNDLAIWTISMAPDARFTLPAAASGTNRMLYFYGGASIGIADRAIPVGTTVRLRADAEVIMQNGPAESEMLLLQGRPIGEPIVQYGPFVMTSRNEIREAIYDYQRTEFGGWPWPSDEHVHSRDAGRHVRYIDGRMERPG